MLRTSLYSAIQLNVSTAAPFYTDEAIVFTEIYMGLLNVLCTTQKECDLSKEESRICYQQRSIKVLTGSAACPEF